MPAEDQKAPTPTMRLFAHTSRTVSARESPTFSIHAARFPSSTAPARSHGASYLGLDCWAGNVENSYAGRRLYRFAVLAGLVDVDVHLTPVVTHDLNIARYSVKNADVEAAALAAGAVTQEEPDRHKASQERLDRMGAFYASVLCASCTPLSMRKTTGVDFASSSDACGGSCVRTVPSFYYDFPFVAISCLQCAEVV